MYASVQQNLGQSCAISCKIDATNLRCFSAPCGPHDSVQSFGKQTTACNENLIIKTAKKKKYIYIYIYIWFPSSPYGVEDYLPPSSKAAAHLVGDVVEGDAARSRTVVRIVTPHFMRRWLHCNYRRLSVDGPIVRIIGWSAQ